MQKRLTLIIAIFFSIAITKGLAQSPPCFVAHETTIIKDLTSI